MQRNVIKMELYSEAAICPANPKQTRVLLEVLFPDLLLVALPFKGSTALLVYVCEWHCLDPVCQKELAIVSLCRSRGRVTTQSNYMN